MADKIRQGLSELDIIHGTATTSSVDTMASYFARQTTKDQILDKVKELYGLGIRTVVDPNNTDAVYETYVKQGFKTQVDGGMIPVISIGFGQKVVNALSVLFTEPGQKFSLKHPTIEDDLSDAQDLLNSYRREAGFLGEMVRSDRRSVELGSSAVFTTFHNGAFKYQVLKPSDVAFIWGDMIIEDGQSRAVDTKDIDDASVVILRLSPSNDQAGSWNFLAVQGESTELPNGRWTNYVAKEFTDDIPPIGDPEATDYEIEGVGPANPLTYYRLQNPEKFVPEYPLSVIDGGVAESSQVMPVSENLYNDSLSFDVQASRLLDTSGNEARGTIVIERDKIASSAPLPETVIGVVVGSPGQKIDKLTSNGSASKQAMEVMDDALVHAGASYSVPDYMILSNERSGDEPSGVQLEIKSRPLIKFRQRRIDINALSVKRIFDTERAYLDMFAEGDENLIRQIVDSDQVWEAGAYVLPENKKEMVDRLIALRDAGIIDTIAVIREYYSLATDTEAEDLYRIMADRSEEFPPLNDEDEPPAPPPRPTFTRRTIGQ